VLPPFKGNNLPGVMVLKNLADGIKIRNHIDTLKPASTVIIGAGLIGLELAEAFVKKGIAVTMIEKAEGLAPAFSDEFRKIIASALSSNGVNAVTGATVNAINGTEGNFTVETDKGQFEAEFVVISTGVRPNTHFLQNSEIKMLGNGAIVVDEKCGTSVPGVLAAGDCATVTNLVTGKTDFIPMATNANKQGRVAGLQAAGVKEELFRGSAGTQMVKVFELEAAKTGFNRYDAERHGIDVIDKFIEWRSRAGYYPGAKSINVKLIVRSDNRKIIGAEIAGTDFAALRINPVAVAITAGMTVEDFAYTDFGYSPPFAPVWEPVIAVAQNFIKREKSG
jgi:NADPH-dependent 2,4-dienoyl-CoA reductase/sulfur reductase-like enzyme